VVKALALGFVRLYGVEHGDFDVAILNDDAEEARLEFVEVGFLRLCPAHLLALPRFSRHGIESELSCPFGLTKTFLVAAFLLHYRDAVLPMVVRHLQVVGADVLGIVRVLAAASEQTDEVAPQPIVVGRIAVPCRYLVGLPTAVKVGRIVNEVLDSLVVMPFHQC